MLLLGTTVQVLLDDHYKQVSLLTQHTVIYAFSLDVGTKLYIPYMFVKLWLVNTRVAGHCRLY